MTTYKHKIGSTEFDVTERTTHFHIIWKDGVPFEVQVHRTRDWSLAGTIIRSDKPTATVVKFDDLVGVMFSNTGLTFEQSVAVFEAVLLPYVPTLVDATGVLHDPVPEHATSAVQSLIEQHGELEASLAAKDAIHALRHDQLTELENQIDKANEALAAVQTQAERQGSHLEQAILDATNELHRMEQEAQTKLKTIATLDEAIREKSARSTELTHQITAASSGSPAQ